MGEVYHAFRLGDGATVALKVIPPRGRGGEQQILSFNREIRAMARLDHPGIIQVLDYGQDEQGGPSFVMEYVGGLSLKEPLDRPIPWAALGPFLVSILDSLSQVSGEQKTTQRVPANTEKEEMALSGACWRGSAGSARCSSGWTIWSTLRPVQHRDPLVTRRIGRRQRRPAAP